MLPSLILPRHLQRPTTRFSGHAAAYHASRPSLPPPIITAVLDGFDTSNLTIVDLGAGTGLSSLAFAPYLSGRSRIIAVEPNPDMRAHAHPHAAHNDHITYLAARAEGTGLPDASADLVISVTAFHWFDPAAAPCEIARILRPTRSRVALLATDRNPADPIACEFHRLIGDSPDAITPDNIRQWYGHALLPGLYSPCEGRVITAENPQRFDLERLLERARSSSYWPAETVDQHAAAERLSVFFTGHADAMGALILPYRTIGLIAERG